jgi:hypothetical protein
MEDEEHLFDGVGAPGPETRANGAAILASGLTREAQLLAATAAHLATTLDFFPVDAQGPEAEDRRIMRDGAREASALAGALVVMARQIMRQPDDPGEAARQTLGRLPRGTLSIGEVLSHLRTAALLPLTDDGAARVAAAEAAQIFEREFTAAWHKATGG